MPHPQNAEHIRKLTIEVTEEWNIPLTKIHAILTNNGSNMIKAFCTHRNDDDNNIDENDDYCIVDDDFEDLHEDENVDDTRALLEEEIEYDDKEAEHEEAF